MLLALCNPPTVLPNPSTCCPHCVCMRLCLTHPLPSPNPSENRPTRTKTVEKSPQLTILSNLQAGSLGCAPTPSQYFALAISNLTSLNFLGAISTAAPAPGIAADVLGVFVSLGVLGIGSYVPSTSSGFEFRAVRAWATTML